MITCSDRFPISSPLPFRLTLAYWPPLCSQLPPRQSFSLITSFFPQRDFKKYFTSPAVFLSVQAQSRNFLIFWETACDSIFGRSAIQIKLKKPELKLKWHSKYIITGLYYTWSFWTQVSFKKKKRKNLELPCDALPTNILHIQGHQQGKTKGSYS